MTTVLDMRPYQAQYSISTMHLQQSLASSPESVNQTSTSLTLAEMQAELDEMNRLYTHTITHHHPDSWTIYQTLTDRFLSWLGGRPSQREVIMGQIKQGEAAILDATLAVQMISRLTQTSP